MGERNLYQRGRLSRVGAQESRSQRGRGRSLVKLRIRRAILVASLTTALLPAQQQLRMEPPHDSGQSVTPAYEGWFANADGTYSILYGYFNRNMKQELDIPVGPD